MTCFTNCVLAAILASIAVSASAQETPTEREAARDVLQKMDALEQSLDVPALVAKLTGAERRRATRSPRAPRQLMDTELLAMARRHHARIPEIGFEEKRSVAEPHRLPARSTTSAWRWASRGLADRVRRALHAATTARPNLGVILEYDALRGTKGAFHGDQHSTQGPVGIAAAVAIAEYLDADEDAGQRHRVRHAGRGDDAAEREDGDAQGARLRRHGRHRAQPRRRRDVAPRAGLRHVLPEHRRREVHVQRRAGAPDDGVERPQRARRR